MNKKLIGLFVGLVLALSVPMANAIMMNGTFSGTIFDANGLGTDGETITGIFSYETSTAPADQEPWPYWGTYSIDTENWLQVSYTIDGVSYDIPNSPDQFIEGGDDYTIAMRDDSSWIPGAPDTYDLYARDFDRIDTNNNMDYVFYFDLTTYTDILMGDSLEQSFSWTWTDDDLSLRDFNDGYYSIATVRDGVLDIVSGRFTLNSVTVSQFTTVPEPSSLLLMGIGLAGLGFVRRRKQA